MAVTIHADGRIVNSSGINVAAEPMIDQWRIDDTSVNGTNILIQVGSVVMTALLHK